MTNTLIFGTITSLLVFVLLFKYDTYSPYILYGFVIVMFVILYNNKLNESLEHMTDEEALQNLAALYKSGDFTLTNLKVTGNFEAGNVLIKKENDDMSSISHKNYESDTANKYAIAVQKNGDLAFNTTTGNYFFRQNNDTVNNVAALDSNGIVGGTNAFRLGRYGTNPDWSVLRHAKTPNDNAFALGFNKDGNAVHINTTDDGYISLMRGNDPTNKTMTQLTKNRIYAKVPIVGGQYSIRYPNTDLTNGVGWDDWTASRTSLNVGNQGILKDVQAGEGVLVNVGTFDGDSLYTGKMWCNREPDKTGKNKVFCQWFSDGNVEGLNTADANSLGYKNRWEPQP